MAHQKRKTARKPTRTVVHRRTYGYRSPKRARKAAGISLAKAVKLSGVSKATICRIENGDPALPDNLTALETVYQRAGVGAVDFSRCPRV